MTPLEELQAAHKRLSELRAGSSPAPWTAVYIEDDKPLERTVADATMWAISDDTFDLVDADLIVTLHRTIDAQLSMLELGIAEHTLLAEQWGNEYGEATEVDLLGIVGLARAINGEAS